MLSVGRRVAQLPWRMLAADSLSRFFFVVKGICAVEVFNSHVLGLTCPMGPSMLPIINLTGDIVLVNKTVSWWGRLNTGDVVVMRSPENPRKLIAKRILGVEEDSVTYLADPTNTNTSKTVVVPKGHVWVQGDNIHSSKDSRNFGPVPRGLVEGKIFCRVWPPENIGLIDSKLNHYEPPTNADSAN